MESKLSFNGAWSMAVGGMVGGGIFSTMGVVVAIAGGYAWLSFLCAGIVALAAGYSYERLAALYGEGGGVFTYLSEAGAKSTAGSLSWILITGYVLTNAVYAFTFGQYLAHVAGMGDIFARTTAVLITLSFIFLNLKGVSAAGRTEIILVWFKVAVLAGLALWGLAKWQPAMLTHGIEISSPYAALFGGASVFMAYEGFQLLSYDYDSIDRPEKTLPLAMITSILTVIVIYVLVAMGATMLVGADEVIKHQEVALAIAGKNAFGITGLIIVTIAAAFSTGSAINATLFSTARLSKKISDNGLLPKSASHLNREGVPDRTVIALGSASALFAALGNITSLVEAASLAFLATFAIVCLLAFLHKAGVRLFTGFGAAASSAAVCALTYRIYVHKPHTLLYFAAAVFVSFAGRPYILKYLNGKK